MKRSKRDSEFIDRLVHINRVAKVRRQRWFRRLSSSATRRAGSVSPMARRAKFRGHPQGD